MKVKQLLHNIVDHSIKAELYCTFWRNQLIEYIWWLFLYISWHLILYTSIWEECFSMNICLLGILMSGETENQIIVQFYYTVSDLAFTKSTTCWWVLGSLEATISVLKWDQLKNTEHLAITDVQSSVAIWVLLGLQTFILMN